MAHPKSGLVSSIGLPFQILKTLIDRVHDCGGDDESVRQLLSDKSLLNQVAQIIAGAGPTTHWFNSANDLSYWLNMKYGENNLPMFLLKDKRISAEMFTDDVREGIRDEERGISLVKFKYVDNLDSALYWMRTQGCEPASFSRLIRCAGNWQFRHLMPNMPIVAPMETWTEPKRGKKLPETFVPYVHYDGDVCYVGFVSVYAIPKTWAYAIRRPYVDHTVHLRSRLMTDAMPEESM